jgi:hypothetical protein
MENHLTENVARTDTERIDFLEAARLEIGFIDSAEHTGWWIAPDHANSDALYPTLREAVDAAIAMPRG